MASYFVPGEEEGDERCFEVETIEPGRYRVVTPEGQEYQVDAYTPEAGRLHLLLDGQSFDVDVRELGGEFIAQLRGETHRVNVLNERERRMRIAGVGERGGGGPTLESPMAGKVVAVHVEEGASVEAGDKVVIVEAMKMENDLKAHKAGAVSRVCVAPGDTVEIGDVLLEIAD